MNKEIFKENGFEKYTDSANYRTLIYNTVQEKI